MGMTARALCSLISSSSVARGGQGGQLPPLFSRNVRGILTLVEKREAFNDLSVTKESEKLIISLRDDLRSTHTQIRRTMCIGFSKECS